MRTVGIQRVFCSFSMCTYLHDCIKICVLFAVITMIKKEDNEYYCCDAEGFTP